MPEGTGVCINQLVEGDPAICRDLKATERHSPEDDQKNVDNGNGTNGENPRFGNDARNIAGPTLSHGANSSDDGDPEGQTSQGVHRVVTFEETVGKGMMGIGGSCRCAGGVTKRISKGNHEDQEEQG